MAGWVCESPPDPLLDGAQSLGVQVIDALPTVGLRGDEPGVEKDAELLRDGRLRNCEAAGNFGGGLGSGPEEIQDLAARVVRDGLIYGVELGIRSRSH